MKLGGGAASWYQNARLLEDADKWTAQELLQQLIRRYVPAHHAADPFAALLSVTMTGSLNDYIARFEAASMLVPIANCSAAQRVSVFRQGLRGHLDRFLLDKDVTKMTYAVLRDTCLAEDLKQRAMPTPHQHRQPTNPRPAQRPAHPTPPRAPVYATSMVPASAGATFPAAAYTPPWPATPPTPWPQQPTTPGLHATSPFAGPRLAKLDDAERARCAQMGLCFRCRQPGHARANCPLNLSRGEHGAQK